MPYPANDDQDDPTSTEPAAPFSTVAGAPSEAAVSVALPTNETVARPVAVSQPEVPEAPTVEARAGNSFRVAVNIKPKPAPQISPGTTEVSADFSHALRTSLEEIATGLTEINSKIIEFGQANTQSNLDFAMGIAGARDIRDIMDAQTAFLRTKCEAYTAQLNALQSMSNDIAERASAPFKEQARQAGKTLTSC